MIELISHFIIFSLAALLLAWFSLTAMKFINQMFFRKPFGVVRVIVGLFLYLVVFMGYAIFIWIVVVMGANWIFGEKLV